jgi:hypothetical protein
MRLYEYMFQMWRIDPYVLCIRTFNHIWNMYSYNRIWEIVVLRIEISEVFRSGFRTKIRQPCPEIFEFLTQKISKITIFGTVKNIQNLILGPVLTNSPQIKHLKSPKKI